MALDRTYSADGDSLLRKEDERLLTGKATFVADVKAENAAYAVFVRSPLAHAKILSIDIESARSLSGVLGVFTGADLVAAGFKPLRCIRPTDSSDGRPFSAPIRHAVAIEIVRHVGEAVAIVVAETEAVATDAAELVDVDYAFLDVTIDPETSGESAFDWESGDRAAVEEAFATAIRVVEVEARNNRVLISPLEPRGAVASYDDATGTYHLEAPTQGVHLVRRLIAPTLDVPESRLVLQTRDVGGSFGAKLVNLPEQTALLFAARAVGRPVRWVAMRTENHLTDIAGRDQVGRAAMALDADHRIRAVRYDTYANLGAYASAIGPSPPTLGFAATMCGVYDIPAVHLTVHGRYTNTAPTDAYRGSGKPESIYLLERLVEKAASETGLGPVAFRRRNLIDPRQMPYTAANGYRYDSADFPRILDRALDCSAWDSFAERRQKSAQNGLLRGIGLAMYIHTTGVASGEMSSARLSRTGSTIVETGLQSSGQGHETTFAQLVAAYLGISIEDVRIVQGDSRSAIDGGPTAGSSSLQVGGMTILRAVDGLIAEARSFAARLYQVAGDDIEYDSGRLRNKTTGSRLSLRELAVRAAEEGHEIAAGAHLEGEILTVPNGAYVCEVDVDPETGNVDVVSFHAVDDVGRRLNPRIVEGQIHGGIAQGIGQAVLENVVYDEESGQMLTGSMMDYGIPRADDLPRFDLIAADTPTENNPLGMKGVGEIGCIGAPAAVINAIVNAIGTDRIDMPATPEKVWRSLRSAAEKRDDSRAG